MNIGKSETTALKFKNKLFVINSKNLEKEFSDNNLMEASKKGSIKTNKGEKLAHAKEKEVHLKDL